MAQYRGEKVRYRRRGLLRLRLRQLLEARGLSRLRPGQVHRPQPQHHIPADPADRTFSLIRADTIERLCGALRVTRASCSSTRGPRHPETSPAVGGTRDPVPHGGARVALPAMQDAHEFLRSLTVVLAVAAVTTVLFQRLRQPVVLGYLIAGLIVGPHVPILLVATPPSCRRSPSWALILLISRSARIQCSQTDGCGRPAGLTRCSSPASWCGWVHDRPHVGWTP